MTQWSHQNAIYMAIQWQDHNGKERWKTSFFAKEDWEKVPGWECLYF